MIIHLNLTEDHLKLVSFFNLEDRDDEIAINKNVMLTLQSHLLDDVATILGYRDRAIKNTEYDADGSAYPDDVENYLMETYKYVSDNMYYIESLLHQNALKGITPGHYKAKDNELVWTRVEEK